MGNQNSTRTGSTTRFWKKRRSPRPQQTNKDPSVQEQQSDVLSSSVHIDSPRSDVEQKELKELARPQLVVSTQRERSVSEAVSESYESDVYSSDSEEAPDDGSADFIGNYNGFGEADETETRDFLCLSQDELLAQQEKIVLDLAELLQISKVAARELLKHFHWDRDRLVQAYFEDPRKVCTEAKVDTTLDGDAIELTGVQDCSICAEASAPEDSTALSCRHPFCNDCWRSYLVMKISEGEVIGITCPSYRCKVIVSDDVIRARISPELYDKYQRFISHAFVETNRYVGWCPAPNCGRAVNAIEVVHGEVTCGCGYRFCFRCKHEAHAPATCEQVKKWQEKCRDDSETQNWINSFTQSCPKCDSAIEKNGGCNHMVCRSCRHEFCWVCLSDWKGHSDYYSCNRFEKKKKQEEKKGPKDKRSKKAIAISNREEAKVALEKYLHYNHRYLNHARSKEFEVESKEKAQKAMRALQEGDNSSCGEVQYIAESTEQLIACQEHSSIRMCMRTTYLTTRHRRRCLNICKRNLKRPQRIWQRHSNRRRRRDNE